MEAKVIQNPADARWLLKRGHILIDIKARKEDKSQTVFVFKMTTLLEEDLAKLKNRVGEKVENK
ncbi:MAG: hypothetical protein WCO84_01580 [bacterium]